MTFHFMPATLLREIAGRRREALLARRAALPDGLPPRPPDVPPARLGGFVQALRRPEESAPLRLLCELKKASPSRGLLREDFDVPSIARAYAEGGATALSVLTEPDYFQGAPEYLTQARRSARLPCLMKDFVIEPWQLDEAVSLGADAVLLIVGLLEGERLPQFVRMAHARGLDALVEVHDVQELARALAAEARLIGVNNRDLSTFEVDPGLVLRLRPAIPRDVTVVAESGIATAEDVSRLSAAGVDAALIGEAFMREPDVARATRTLVDAARQAVAR
jgi:indole-3-glycerol phosphate synthase